MSRDSIYRRKLLKIGGAGFAVGFGGSGAGIALETMNDVETNQYILNTNNDDAVELQFENDPDITLMLEDIEEKNGASVNAFSGDRIYSAVLKYDEDYSAEVFGEGINHLPDFEVTDIGDYGLELTFDEVIDGEYR